MEGDIDLARLGMLQGVGRGLGDVVWKAVCRLDEGEQRGGRHGGLVEVEVEVEERNRLWDLSRCPLRWRPRTDWSAWFCQSWGVTQLIRNDV